MIRIFYRLLFVLFLLSGLRVAAQSSEVALSTSTVVDEGESIEVDCDEQAGHGFSFNRRWMGHLSSELGLVFLIGELRIASRLDAEAKTLDLESELTWTVADEAVAVAPVTSAAGVRF